MAAHNISHSEDIKFSYYLLAVLLNQYDTVDVKIKKCHLNVEYMVKNIV